MSTAEVGVTAVEPIQVGQQWQRAAMRSAITIVIRIVYKMHMKNKQALTLTDR